MVRVRCWCPFVIAAGSPLLFPVLTCFSNLRSVRYAVRFLSLLFWDFRFYCCVALRYLVYIPQSLLPRSSSELWLCSFYGKCSAREDSDEFVFIGGCVYNPLDKSMIDLPYAFHITIPKTISTISLSPHHVLPFPFGIRTWLGLQVFTVRRLFVLAPLPLFYIFAPSPSPLPVH